MRIIDLDEYVHDWDSPENGMKRLQETLREIAAGDELVLLKFTDRDRADRTLVLAPMSRMEITLK